MALLRLCLGSLVAGLLVLAIWKLLYWMETRFGNNRKGK